jgi:transposase InsO family protein
MPADVNHKRYILPKLSHSVYHRWMKTLVSAHICDAHDAVEFRVKVLEHATTFGWKSAISAFGIGKTTLYRWKATYRINHARLSSLIPNSTRPHHVRCMQTDPRIIPFLQSFRETYGNKSKYVMKPFLDAYTQSLGISSLSPTTIGKLIRRNHWFTPRRKRWSKKRLGSFQRTKYTPKEKTPGYLEVDCIVLSCADRRYIFVSVIDVVTKCALVRMVPSQRALHTLSVLQEYRCLGYPVRIVQTDNGSEFLGVFHEWVIAQGTPHQFIYPHSPRINGVVERFNRTVQEECIERSDELFYDSEKFNQTLNQYMIWYNTKRPHHSLHFMTPDAYYKQLVGFPICM